MYCSFENERKKHSGMKYVELNPLKIVNGKATVRFNMIYTNIYCTRLIFESSFDKFQTRP